MNYFYLYIFLLLFFIFSVSYFNTYMYTLNEGFNDGKQNIVLLGDSILKNNNYVSDGKSVENLLEERTNGKILCLAKDDSKISNIYNQVSQIPHEFNSRSTTIFLSVGGNDLLLANLEELNSSTSSTSSTIFNKYTELINFIQIQFPEAIIVLLDIYHPNDNKYEKYRTTIHEWNNQVYNFGKQNNTSILKISNILTQPEDFSSDIEPSSSGSQKIVDTLLENY